MLRQKIESQFWTLATLIRIHWGKLSKKQRVIVVEGLIKLSEKSSMFRSRVDNLIKEIWGKK
jgi:hypothetical protein